MNFEKMLKSVRKKDIKITTINNASKEILLNNEDYGINKINVAAIEKTDSLIWLGTEQGLIKFNSITKSKSNLL